MQNINRGQGVQLPVLTPQQIEANRQRLATINNRLTERVNEKYQTYMYGVPALAFGLFCVFMYSRSQTHATIDPDDPTQVQAHILKMAQESHTFSQLLLLSLAYLLVLHVIKRHRIHIDRDHKGSPYLEQVSQDEWEYGKEEGERLTDEIADSDKYKKYQRFKGRYEREMNALGNDEAKIERELEKSDDLRTMEKIMLEIDRKHQIVKEKLRSRDDVSGYSMYSQNYPSQSNFERTSMDPPATQPTLLQRRLTGASNFSRRDSTASLQSFSKR